MPLIEGSRGIWVTGYFAYRELPKVEKTLIICCQASEQPDCTWMLHVFFVQHVPWQFFISLVLLRHHAERRKEAQQIGAEIIFFNPGYKSQQMERILV